MTPAEFVRGNMNNFVVDVPVQGPTDEGMRAASCWWAQNRIPAHPGCADCTGPIPAWTRRTLAPGGPAGPNAGIGDNMNTISLSGARVRGFSLGAAGDPDVWSKLSSAQQQWVTDALVKLNGLIVATTKTTCPTWAPSITAAGGCFQAWFNNAFAGPTALTRADGSKIVLRTDGVFDQDTLDALRTVTGLNPKDFPTAFPSAAITTTETKKLSTGAMVGLAAGGAAAVGGIIYFVTRKGSKSRRSRK